MNMIIALIALSAFTSIDIDRAPVPPPPLDPTSGEWTESYDYNADNLDGALDEGWLACAPQNKVPGITWERSTAHDGILTYGDNNAYMVSCLDERLGFNGEGTMERMNGITRYVMDDGGIAWRRNGFTGRNG